MTTTFRDDLPLLESVLQMCQHSIKEVEKVADIAYTVTFQVLPPAVTSKSKRLGGSSLGLDSSDGPLVLCLVTLTWSSSVDDATVSGVGRRIIGQIDHASKSRGLFNPFKYLNYADVDQDPISGYGPDVVAHLKAVSTKYDPLGLFQRAMTGGFKVFGA